ncbi:MAG: ribonuclease HII [Erysipelotrichaceae bacterium]|nr:ribonuclease HII [Erysipelotrichaceae bacterium]
MANFDYENQYWWSGKEIVAGLDEAGRGPIAGPLVIGICVFPPFYDNYEINDSKQLTDKKRRKLLEIIKRDALYYNFEVISVEEVDQYNIYAATQLGMERAIKRMEKVPEAILTDAMPLPHIDKKIPLEAIIKGDCKSVTIAAASIIAKVVRDDIMIELDKKYPQYNLKQNKGYCTMQHMNCLKEYGICDIHRKTYEPVIQYIKHDEQITIDEILKDPQNIK